MGFLPVTIDEIRARGADAADFIIVTGDAYVDHPSFGAALIGRLLASRGYLTAVIAQPDWRDAGNFASLGEPRLAFLVTGGNLDSMVANYTSAKKRRSKDMYSPGGRAGLRPDRAAVVYSNKIRETYKKTPIVLGGLEASLRRLAHYDYWSDSVRRSILLDSAADILVYGMGERQIVEIAQRLADGVPACAITGVRGTVCKTRDISGAKGHIMLPPFSEISADKKRFAESFMLQYKNADHRTAKTLIEPYGKIFAVQNPPAVPLAEKELDRVYAMNFERACHPMYDEPIPAIEEVRFSITGSRGCFGGCSFCALSFHQGRTVAARSHASIVSEAVKLTSEPGFKGYIHDVGGPTANFRRAPCEKQRAGGACEIKMCLFPRPCEAIDADHGDFLALLRKLRAIPGVKKVFIRSGIRYDYLLLDKKSGVLKELCEHHVSGQLKVAPEHVSKRALALMGKPGADVYEEFKTKYARANEELGLKQYLVPYFMSGHPGCGLAEAVELAEHIRDNGVQPEQVQDFYPTPGTLSTCMYHTETDPRSGKRVYVAKTSREKALQRALMQYKLPKNRALVKEALIAAGREDLIGRGKKCLIYK